MNKMMSMILMVLGVAFMCVITLIYSFSSFEISKTMYVLLWFACIGLVRIAAGLGFGLER